MEVIRTEKKLCTHCMEEHEVKIVHVQNCALFKGMFVDYMTEYYYCDREDSLYVDEDMFRRNCSSMKTAMESV